MFPSSGYFKSVVCPFYSSGLCERPYCHFKHVKQHVKAEALQISTIAPPTSSSGRPISQYNTSNRQASHSTIEYESTYQKGYTQALHLPAYSTGKRNNRSNSYKLKQNKSSSHRPHEPQDRRRPHESQRQKYEKQSSPTIDWYSPPPFSLPDGPRYIPTIKAKSHPVPETRFDLPPSSPPQSPSGLDEPSSPVKFKYESSPAPEYNPTPISKLPKKYASYSTSTHDEYDPRSNYATTSLYIPTKISRLKSLPSTSGSDGIKKCDSGFIDDDTGVEGTFSDEDDDDEKLVAVNQSNDIRTDKDVTYVIQDQSEANKTKVVAGRNTQVEAKHTTLHDKIDVEVKIEEDDDNQRLNVKQEQSSDVKSEPSKDKAITDTIEISSDSDSPPDEPIYVSDSEPPGSNTDNSDSKHQAKVFKVIGSEGLECVGNEVNEKNHSEELDVDSNVRHHSKEPDNDTLVEISEINETKSRNDNTAQIKLEKIDLTKSDELEKDKLSSSSKRDESSSKKDKLLLTKDSSKLSSHSKHSKVSSSITKNSSKSPSKSSSSKHSSKATHDSSKIHVSSSKIKQSSTSTSSAKDDTIKKSSSHKDSKHHRSSSSSNKDKHNKSTDQDKHKTSSNKSDSKHKISDKSSSKHKISDKDTNKHKTASEKDSKNKMLSDKTSKHKTSSSDKTSKHRHHTSCNQKETNSTSSVKDGSPNKRKHSSSKDKHSSTYSKKLKIEIKEDCESSKKEEVKDEESDDGSVVLMSEPEDVFDFDLDFSEEEDVYTQCLNMYKNAKPIKQSPVEVKPKTETITQRNVEEELESVGKKRLAHASNRDTSRLTKVPRKPYSRQTPVQIMHNRFLEMRKLEIALKAKGPTTTVNENGKSTTAPEPTPSTSLLQKRRRQDASNTSKTIAGTIKTGHRVAHTPSKTVIKRPQITPDFGDKIPNDVRQRYLNLIIDECLKLCNSEQEAFDRGLQEEKIVWHRSSTRTVYLNVAVNTIKRLRTESAVPISNEVAAPVKTTNQHTSQKVVSHAAMLGGVKALKHSYTLNRSGGPSNVDMNHVSDSMLYKYMNGYILSEEQLVENGFPRPDPENPGIPKIQLNEFRAASKANHLMKENERICVHCGASFYVSNSGSYPPSRCVFHWGRAYKTKIAGAIVSRYRCCSGDGNSTGCSTGQYHVHEQNKLKTQKGYVTTMAKSPGQSGNYGIYALDCEMVYTFAGIELARITVINTQMESHYETMVKPEKAILDYNTRFSGITADQMEPVTTRLRDVQAVLLSMFSSNSILIGHSLESDLNVLKLIHSTVVDTSVVFPHRLGPPYKKGLKQLMVDHLQKIIQDDVGGHDSKEDAVACMELMRYKIKQDLKKLHCKI